MSIEGRRVSDLEMLDDEVGQSLINFTEDGWIFDYYFRHHRAKTLLVFLPSAAVAGKRMIPTFRRWTWALSLPNYDVLSVSDPTMRMSETMLGGWSIGNKNSWPLLNLLDHISRLKTKYGYENVVFCGSSLGAFMALQLDIIAQEQGFDVGYGGAYAENPQVNLQTYASGSHIDVLAKLGFGVPSRLDVPSEYLERFNVAVLVERTGFAPRGLIVIKESDTHHYTDQLPQLLAATNQIENQDLRVEVIPSAEDPTGHTPLTLEQMVPRIEWLLTRKN